MAVQIILKNSSIEDKRPSASQLTNGEISLNYNESGAFLTCKDGAGNLQQVGGVKIDEDAPDAPVKQTLWFKPSTLTLSVFDGDKWLPIAGGGGGGGGGDITQIIGNDGIDADTISGIVTLDVELAGGDDGLEFKSSKLSATLASATTLGSVKVGDNIDVTDGKISVPVATDSALGVVKAGTGVDIDSDGTLNIDVPQTTTYRGTCDLNNDTSGQLTPDPAVMGDGYINNADAAAIDPSWSPLTGTAKAGDLVIFDGTDWELIPLGTGLPPVTSVNTKTGDVVLSHVDVGAASAAQGALADTSLQPGDDISQLNNDAGYITVAESSVTSVNSKTGDVVLDASDVGALASGDNISELTNDAGYLAAVDLGYTPDAAKGTITNTGGTNAEIPFATSAAAGLITEAATPGTGTVQYARQVTNAGVASWEEIDESSSVTVGETAPVGPEVGDLWWDSSDDSGRLYVWYVDGDSGQWVETSPAAPTPPAVATYWDKTGNNLEPKEVTDNVIIGGGNINLEADGAAGFAAGATTINNEGGVVINRATYSTAISIQGNGATGAFIQTDGDAYFNQAVKVGNSYGDPNVGLYADGSFNFDDKITFNATSPLARISVASPDDQNADIAYFADGFLYGTVGYNASTKGLTLDYRGSTGLSFLSAGVPRALLTPFGDLFIGGTTRSDCKIALEAAGTVVSKDKIVLEAPNPDGGSTWIACTTGTGATRNVRYSVSRDGSTRIGGDAKIGSELANIQLKATGDAIFDGTISSTNYDQSGVSGGGYSIRAYPVGNGNGGSIRVQNVAGANNYNAVQVFNGTTPSANWRQDGTIDIGGTLVGGGASHRPNIQLNADGVGSFKGAVNVINEMISGGQALLNLQSGTTLTTPGTQSGIALGGGTGGHTSYIYGGHRSAGETVLLFQTDNFPGGVKAPATKMMVDANGDVNIGGDLSALNIPQPNISLHANGTAEFKGNIVSGIAGSTTGIGSWIQPAGGIYTTRAAGSTEVLFAGYQKDETTPRASISADGSANFTGTVTAAGHVFNLEPEDPANYTTEVDEEGNETQVYIGPTLDVKDAIETAVAQRTAMRETFQELLVAVKNATDFGQLKAAMLVALEDYA